MKLSQLLRSAALPAPEKDVEICGITADSRQVRPGYLFAALKGVNSDGHDFIPQAAAAGAAAVLCSDDGRKSDFPQVVFIKSARTHYDFARIAAAFYEKQPEYIAAVTGTNGKTSIADFVRQILTMTGRKAASLGTLGLIKNNEEPQYAMTTPDPVTIHRDLRELAEEGYNYLVMETSSHGLCQYRVGGVKVKAAGFTNLTRDHLDYHKTMENYFEAKKILFTDILVAGGSAVLNADSDVYPALKQACEAGGKKIVAYGHKGRELRLLKTTPLPHGQKLELEYYGKNISLNIPLAGEFQAMNVLCALGLAAELTGEPFEIIKYVEKIHGAKGRLELVARTLNGAAVYVDYAHTPDALENVIKAMRPHCTNRLCVLFGCGGDRDKGKRPQMGKIANDLADVIYVTDDNPRSEEAEVIRSEIMAACPRGKNIGDRRTAIQTAISALLPGDVLIVAGKGHEPGQIIKGVTYPFSDHEEVLKACDRLKTSA